MHVISSLPTVTLTNSPLTEQETSILGLSGRFFYFSETRDRAAPSNGSVGGPAALITREMAADRSKSKVETIA